MNKTINNVKNIVQSSSLISPKEQIHTSEEINRQYQNAINEKIYSSKQKIINYLQDIGVDAAGIETINSLSPEDFSSGLREDFKLDFEDEGRQYKLGFYENLIDKKTGREHLFDGGLEELMFRKNDALFLVAHGSEQGYINIGDYFLKSKTLVEKMYDTGLIPDNIKKLYTISCYGGKQQSFIGPNGIEVKSAHTSTNAIFGGDPHILNHNYFFSLSDGDVIDEVKKISLADGDFEIVHRGNEIREAIENSFNNSSHTLTQARNESKESFDLINNFTYKLSKEPSKSKRIISAKTLQKKRLSGKGKLASAINIVSTAANIASAGASFNKTASRRNKSINKSRKKINSISKNFDNSYAQQMAADISSYKYGKHMTGFVNF